MKERPLLLSGPLVVATMKGIKTQTRRVMRVSRDVATGGTLDTTRFSLGRGRCMVLGPNGWPRDIVKWSPYGVPGDRLWVRECWALEDLAGETAQRIVWKADRAAKWHEDGAKIFYLESAYEPERWKPSIHMPRWASRLTLEITEIRVQRLQEISEEDARAEGVQPLRNDGEHICGPGWPMEPPYDDSARAAFALLWDSINDKRLVGGQPVTWAANPWVWAITYRVVKP